MTPRRLLFLLRQLEALADRLGIAVRAEPFLKGVLDGRGGLCWVDGKPMIVMDENLAIPDRVAIVASGLAQLELDTSQVPLLALEAIQAAQKKSQGHARRARRSSRPRHPGLARARPRPAK